MTFQHVDGSKEDIAGFLADTLRRRRLRDEYLSPDILNDASWDMMLDLYLSERSGREVTVSSLCIASHAPFTTALRWIAKLEQEGLIYRQPRPDDRRSSHILLSEKGRIAMEGWACQAMRPSVADGGGLHAKAG